MTDTSTDDGTGGGKPNSQAPSRSFINQLEIDLRLLGMLGAFIVVC